MSDETLEHPVRQVAEAVAALIAAPPDFLEATRQLNAIDEQGLVLERSIANRSVRGIPTVSSDLPRIQLTPTQELAVFVEDRFTCRYCARRTVHVAVLRELQRLRVWGYFDPGPPKWWHPIGYTHVATVDHVVPRVHEASNWVTACWRC